MPKQITIGSRTIPVKMVAGLTDGNGQSLMGMYDSHEQVMSINSDMPMSQQIETMWHELIHAIHDYNGVDQAIQNEIAASQYDGGDPEARAYNLEEGLTNGFSKVFLQVITDNNLLNLTP